MSVPLFFPSWRGLGLEVLVALRDELAELLGLGTGRRA